MAQHLYPIGTFTEQGLTYVGQPTAWQALDADSNSYVIGLGTATFTVDMADPTMNDDQLCSVTVQFDARPEPGFESSWVSPLLVELFDGATGAIYARAEYRYGGQSGFAPSTVKFGSIVDRSAINRSAIRAFTVGAPRIQQWRMNDLHIIVTDLFDPPTAIAVGPTGALSDNTPTVQFTLAVDDAATETIAYARLRVFSEAQYSAGGFNPETSPAYWDSGNRTPTSMAITTIVLPAGNWRAYVAGIQAVSPGLPWTGQPTAFGGASLDFPDISTPQVVYQLGHFTSFVAFSIVTAAPAKIGPTIDADGVRDLTDAQRLRITEPFEPLPRVSLYTADGVFVRQLNIVSGSVTLDATALIRGQLNFTCTDTDLVPARSGLASGELFPLHPFGSYVNVLYGVQLGRFEQVFVNVGVFRLTSVKPDRAKALVTVKGKDFGLNLQEARFGQDITRQSWDTVPPTPFTVLDTAQQIITEAGLAYRTPTADASSVVTNYLNKRGGDRLRDLQGLANSIDGWVHYADIDGVIYFGPGPDISVDDIVYTFNDGDPGAGRLTAQIIDRDEELSRDDVYDVVIASDQAGTVVGGAYDATPGSIIARSAATPGALYIGAGPFSPGGKPYFYSSPLTTTQAGVEAAARTLFPQVALPADEITAECAPIPDLRPDKMVAMPRSINGPIEKWQILRVRLPLSVGPDMSWDAVTITEATSPAS